MQTEGKNRDVYNISKTASTEEGVSSSFLFSLPSMNTLDWRLLAILLLRSRSNVEERANRWERRSVLYPQSISFKGRKKAPSLNSTVPEGRLR